MIPLIDGDVIAHISCKNRWECLQRYRGITKAHSSYREKPLPTDDQTFSKEEGNRYITESMVHLKQHLKHITERFYCKPDDVLMAMKGSENYRDDVYVDYKAHRKNKPDSNHFVSIIRHLAVLEGLAIEADGREVDDYIRIWATEASQKEIDYVIVSNDKDLKCIKGLHFNPKTNEYERVSEDAAMRNYYEQLLKGDATDNIPGIPGIGPKTAVTMLEGCRNDAEFKSSVIQYYQAAFGEEWRDYLLSNGKMIYIQRHMNDYFTLEDWEIVEEQIEIEEPAVIIPETKVISAKSIKLK